jgi:hypothetical protein
MKSSMKAGSKHIQISTATCYSRVVSMNGPLILLGMHITKYFISFVRNIFDMEGVYGLNLKVYLNIQREYASDFIESHL